MYILPYICIYTVHIHRGMLTHGQEGDDGVEGDGRANHRKYSGEGLHQPRCRCRPAQLGPYRPCCPLVIHFKVLHMCV